MYGETHVYDDLNSKSNINIVHTDSLMYENNTIKKLEKHDNQANKIIF